ncbi:hypothetical protein ACQPZ8_07035 [Actinomadura nitritigenes]|uniref:hypothetical protein n=1 Tax=Actinomadura nitritigenes TaxID=134602 RepID=UPI003D8DB44D
MRELFVAAADVLLGADARLGLAEVAGRGGDPGEAGDGPDDGGAGKEAARVLSVQVGEQDGDDEEGAQEREPPPATLAGLGLDVVGQVPSSGPWACSSSPVRGSRSGCDVA